MDPWVGGFFGLAGVALGASITHGAAWWQRKKRHRAYWQAIRAEADLCHGDSLAYLKGEASAPLYRLSTIAYSQGFPALLSDGAVSEDCAKTVLHFYSLVDQMNRGLDQAQDAKGDDETLEREIGRLFVKATYLASKEENSAYRRLCDALEEAIY